VGAYFFDSSAIVKRYVTETGSGWVRGITDPTAANDVYVARIAGAEVVSACVRHNPPLTNLAAVLANFKFDFQHQYQRLALTEQVVLTAMRLAELHRLRGV
jgi:predicted nucleic acid-binding protein